MYLVKKLHLKPLVIMTLCLSFAHVATANPSASLPTPPDAGALQRQIEQSIQPTPPTAHPHAPVLPETQPAPNAVTVTVRAFNFKGNTRIDDSQLQKVVAPFLNRPLDFSGLQQAALAVAQAYRDAGWVVRAYLPKQSIDEGNVTIQIVEAVFGNTRFSNPSFEGVKASILQAIVEQAQPHGQIIQNQQIDRALLLLDDLPGVSVVGNLIEGEQNGETDLLLNVNDEPWINTNFTIDNTGATSTGTTRALSNINLNSPLHLGDLLNVMALKTLSSDYVRASYSLPIGSNGWRWGTHASWMSYSLIGDFASSGLSGTSSTTGLDVSYPIVRELYKNLSISTSYDLKQLHNVSPSNPNDYHLDVLSLNLNANLTDDWAGGGLNNVALIATHGSVNLNGSANQANDAASANTQGYYSKWGISANRLQTITDRMSFYGSLTAQTANKNLDSSEKIYIGGANGVRAYPSSEGSGTAGYLMSAEFRQRVDTQFTVSEFYDYGYVTAYRDNDYASGSGGLNSGTNPNNYALQGWGASLGWHSTQGSELKLTFARRIGTNPIANATTGLDGDGTKIINRFWLSAGIAF